MHRTVDSAVLQTATPLHLAVATWQSKFVNKTDINHMGTHLCYSANAGGIPEAVDGSNGTSDGRPVLTPPATAADSSSRAGASSADSVPLGPGAAAEAASPGSSSGGAHPEKKRSSLKSLFKSKRSTVG